MLYDFESDKIPLSWDVCIVGAGPAGIILALKLAEEGMTVGLLEAGGLEYSERSQSLYQVKSTGTELWAASTRLRYFGGTSNHWTGRCRPFERDDFERAPPGDLPGWPISFHEIEKYLPEAAQILGLPAEPFSSINQALPGGNFDADRFFQGSAIRFGPKYIGFLRNSRAIHLVVNCNIVDILLARDGRRVSQLRAVDYQKNSKTLTAKCFVLAAGAIENIRLLLNSQSLQAAKAGGAMIGKGFMEHLNVELGTFVLAEGVKQTRLQYFANKKLSQQQNIGKGNVAFSILDEVKSYGRTAEIKTMFKNIACKGGFDDKVQFLTRFNCPGTGVISTLLEQFPLMNGSRISLDEERDGLGLRKARIHWVLSEYDRSTIKKIAIQVAKDFAAAGLGFVRLSDFVSDGKKEIDVSPHAHHMGGTRMSANSESGVVDENLLVFRTDNLYIASSSVFSTGGGGNPTLPILQLTLRLADHLQKKLS